MEIIQSNRKLDSPLKTEVHAQILIVGTNTLN